MKKIIVKYLTDRITDSELDQLLVWIKKPQNLKKFKKFIRENYQIHVVINCIDEEIALKKVKNAIKRTERPVKFLQQKTLKFAASIVILIALSSYFLTQDFKTENDASNILNNTIKIGSDKAILTLETGHNIILEKGKKYNSKNAESNGENIIYKRNTGSKAKINYHYLTIPRGGQYHLKLTDASEIWLNSESKLKYPTSFIQGEERAVELLYGEAYFIVSPSNENKGTKFKVKTGIQEIEVLGTQFNIKAYKDETSIYTTLIEGKVSIDNTIKIELLKPNQQSVINRANRKIKINNIDVSSEIAWVYGDFIFNRKPLKDIMKVLSRWYDVEVKFEDKKMENIKFFGELSRYQNIEDILNLIETTNTINSYEINNGKILIK
jgi:hypothetical protein|tara:strand:+ start:2112 stop:3254 length:1143 start_codon:yes stop_codon:yes gene_type:complete